MSLSTPTTKEISDNIIAQLEASLNQNIPLMPKSFLRVLAKATAGVFVLLYKYAGFMSLQLFVQTASAEKTTINGVEFIPLVEQGRLIGIGDPVAATNAELLIEVEVENQIGMLPSGSQLINSANGVTYITSGATLLNASVIQVVVRASADQAGGGGKGAIGNLEVGQTLSFANPLANVAREATVVTQSVTGANAESDSAYRQRVKDRFQKRPQGGALADYEQWGKEAAGIINIFPYRSDCPGQVDVYAEATVESSGDPDGIPKAAQLQAVMDSIEQDSKGLASRRPANALVNVLPIARTEFEVVVSGLELDDLAGAQTSITKGIQDYFLSREPFIAGLSSLPRRDRITQSAIGAVVEDIVNARGGIVAGSTLLQSGVSLDVYTVGIGEKAKATVSYL